MRDGAKLPFFCRIVFATLRRELNIIATNTLTHTWYTENTMIYCGRRGFMRGRSRRNKTIGNTHFNRENFYHGRRR